MWKYMVHASGLGVIRCDPEAETYEVYDPVKKGWREDVDGFGTWSGFSSDSLNYVELPEDKVALYTKACDDYVAARAPKDPGAAPQN